MRKFSLVVASHLYFLTLAIALLFSALWLYSNILLTNNGQIMGDKFFFSILWVIFPIYIAIWIALRKKLAVESRWISDEFLVWMIALINIGISSVMNVSILLSATSSIYGILSLFGADTKQISIIYTVPEYTIYSILLALMLRAYIGMLNRERREKETKKDILRGVKENLEGNGEQSAFN